jgi:hypothetical protein
LWRRPRPKLGCGSKERNNIICSMSTDKTKVLAVEGKYDRRVTIAVNRKMTKQILEFNCLGYNTGLKNIKMQIRISVSFKTSVLLYE